MSPRLNTIPGGFLGMLSPDQSKIAYGNGTVSVRELSSGSDRYYGDGSAAGWKDDQTLAVSENVLVDGRPERRLVYLDLASGSRTDSGIPTDQQPGWYPQVACVGDTVVSSLPGQHFVNGQFVFCEPEASRIECFTGTHYLYKLMAGSWPTIVRDVRTGELVAQIDTALSNAALFSLDTGPWVGGNIIGGCRLHSPFGAVHQSRGEAFGAVTDAHGDTILWTVTNEGWDPVIIGRSLARGPFDQNVPAYIVRGVGTDGLQVHVTPDGYFLHGYLNGRGDLNYLTLPFDTPREPYVKPQPPPIELPPWPTDFPPILVGCLVHSLELDAPGNIGNVDTGKAVLIEGYRQADGARWTTSDDQRSRQRLLYLDWKESKAKDAMLANAKADQDQFGGTLLFYFDSNDTDLEPDTLKLARQLKAEGRAVALGIRCYPSGQTPDEMRDRVAAELMAFGMSFPIVLFTSGYIQAWDEDTAITAMRQTAQLAAQYRHDVKAVIITKRPPYSDRLNAEIRAFCDLAPADVNPNALFPKWTPKPVTPVAPVVVPEPVVTYKSIWYRIKAMLNRKKAA